MQRAGDELLIPWAGGGLLSSGLSRVADIFPNSKRMSNSQNVVFHVGVFDHDDCLCPGREVRPCRNAHSLTGFNLDLWVVPQSSPHRLS